MAAYLNSSDSVIGKYETTRSNLISIFETEYVSLCTTLSYKYLLHARRAGSDGSMSASGSRCKICPKITIYHFLGKSKWIAYRLELSS